MDLAAEVPPAVHRQLGTSKPVMRPGDPDPLRQVPQNVCNLRRHRPGSARPCSRSAWPSPPARPATRSTCTTLDDLVRNLKEAEASSRFAKKLQTYLKPAVLVVDEVGYLPLARPDANMVFQLIARRYERGSILATSNKAFSEWGSVFGEDVLASAILDRLLHHCEVVATKGTQTHIGRGSGRPSRWARGWVSVGWLVERDAKADLDLLAGDPDVLDDQAEQALALVEVEAVECLGHALGEAGQALAEPVALGELAALSGKTDLLVGELLAASVDLGGPPLDLGELQQPSLVEVDQPAAFGLSGVELALQAGKLSGEQLVVGGGLAGGDGAFAGQQHLGAEQGGADLVEHERVQLVGADVALGTAALLAGGTQGSWLRQ
jgi:hypothetical protein